MAKYIFVTGGVLSSLGKGIFAASVAKILRSGGVNASIMKIDPYLNCDAGTLNPFEHGEVFVTQDGHECDLDVGNYERYTNTFAKREQNLMMGSVYRAVIDKERKGDYLGKTIQLIPHATNEIKHQIRRAAEVTGCDVLVVEIGGTVGDLESDVVLEAVRQMNFEEPSQSTTFIHLALVPTIITGELKTKPIQHSVKSLLSRGITPNMLVARSDVKLPKHLAEKIALFCNVREENVFCSPTLESIYEVPQVLVEQGIHTRLAERMGLEIKTPDLKQWNDLNAIGEKLRKGGPRVRVGVIGKYAVAKDAYMSVFEALNHAGVNNGVAVDAELVDSEAIEKGKWDLSKYHAIVVPGGFGGRGVEGKITAVRHAREQKVPYLGLCYGMQLAVIELARNAANLEGANTSENNPDLKHPVIDLLPEQKSVKDKGGTMRLGGKWVQVKPNTVAHRIYGSEKIFKRFRHRYEVNPDYIERLEKAGAVFSGSEPNQNIMKILELKDHPFFFGTQFHPEFDSRPEIPEPAFNALVAAAKKLAEKK